MKKIVYSLVLRYLRFFARLRLKKVNPKIIGITGSAGKTSTMAAVEAVLKEKKKLRVSYKANSEIGIPLNILGLSVGTSENLAIDLIKAIFWAPFKVVWGNKDFDTYVVEMGVDSPDYPNNMEYLLTIVKPDVGVFLNAQAVHSQAFDKNVVETDPSKRREEIRKVIALEKGKMIQALPANGMAILNADDPFVMGFSTVHADRTITFGIKNQADVQCVDISPSLMGTNFKFKTIEEEVDLTIKDFALTESYGYTLGAALCVGLSVGYSLKEGSSLLAKYFKLPPGRLSLIEGIHESMIIDSSYNASFIPMIEALELLPKISRGRKLALLGDMRELGEETKLDHQMVAAKAYMTCDKVFLIGETMKRYALPILKEKAEFLENTTMAADIIEKELAKDDLILIKGSQNTLFLETVVERLMKNKEEADKVLCRRGGFWDKKRAMV